VVTVKPGKRYRMRVLQMACYTNTEYSIDGHKLTVIEADSILTEPYEVDSIYLYAGQRYSHILDTRYTKPDAYWIRAQPERLIYTFLEREESGANYTIPFWKNNTNVAVLRYTNSPNLFPIIPADVNVPVHTHPLVESELRPLRSQRAPGVPKLGYADVNIKLDTMADFEAGRFFMNNASYTAPDVPILLQIMSGAMSATDILPKESVIPLRRHQVVEVRIGGTSRETGGPHPWHLHGHDFYVIKTPQSNTVNFDNPMRRDTVSSGMEDEEVIIRFTTDNPGPWFLHCHLDWHLEMGMAVVMAEDTPSIANQKAPEEWFDLCKAYDDYMTGKGEDLHVDVCAADDLGCQSFAGLD
jgi:iron transport multicopper oxidase